MEASISHRRGQPRSRIQGHRIRKPQTDESLLDCVLSVFLVSENAPRDGDKAPEQKPCRFRVVRMLEQSFGMCQLIKPNVKPAPGKRIRSKSTTSSSWSVDGLSWHVRRCRVATHELNHFPARASEAAPRGEPPTLSMTLQAPPGRASLRTSQVPVPARGASASWNHARPFSASPVTNSELEKRSSRIRFRVRFRDAAIQGIARDAMSSFRPTVWR